MWTGNMNVTVYFEDAFSYEKSTKQYKDIAESKLLWMEKVSKSGGIYTEVVDGLIYKYFISEIVYGS